MHWSFLFLWSFKLCIVFIIWTGCWVLINCWEQRCIVEAKHSTSSIWIVEYDSQSYCIRAPTYSDYGWERKLLTDSFRHLTAAADWSVVNAIVAAPHSAPHLAGSRLRHLKMFAMWARSSCLSPTKQSRIAEENKHLPRPHAENHTLAQAGCCTPSLLLLFYCLCLHFLSNITCVVYWQWCSA